MSDVYEEAGNEENGPHIKYLTRSLAIASSIVLILFSLIVTVANLLD